MRTIKESAELAPDEPSRIVQKYGFAATESGASTRKEGARTARMPLRRIPLSLTSLSLYS